MCSTVIPYFSFMIASAFALKSSIGGRSAGISAVAIISTVMIRSNGNPFRLITSSIARLSFP